MSSHRPDILLHSGNFFNFMTPDMSIITVDDIAHGLSNEGRFNGQTNEFYPVAQHAVLVSYLVDPGFEWEGLHHDDAEAVMKDMPKPLKRLLPDYQALEAIIEVSILGRFGITLPLHPSVKRADRIMLATEKRDLMPLYVPEEDDCGGHMPMSQIIVPMTPRQAKAAYLARHFELLALRQEVA